jgi:prevent-host-death family protein
MSRFMNVRELRPAAARRPGATRPQVVINYDRSYNMVMKRVAAAKFKEQCLAILDQLGPEGIVITKHGRPVARLLPAERASADLIGSLRGRIRVRGDVLSTGVKWDAGG